MKKEQLINNGIFYKTAKDITFSQVPMPQEQLDAFQRTTIRSAKRLRYLRAVFLIGGFGTLAYCFIRYLSPPISYVCAVLSAAIMVLGLSAVASTAKAENRLLEIYNSPDERKGLKTVDIETARISQSHASLDDIVYNAILIDGGEFIISIITPPDTIKTMLQNSTVVRIYFYELDDSHRLESIHIHPV